MIPIDNDGECDMKKFLYIMPAVLICMLYALLTALAGGVAGLQPIAFANILMPIAAGVLLRREKWWGCLFGIAVGGLLLYNSRNMMLGFVIGFVLIAYYAAMGLVCVASQKNKK